ncbi:MAG TPA: hypothetical protein VHG91_02445 [Longimicrobium sp.]|nr:hypothetical protein [Longimicrobium sp.]
MKRSPGEWYPLGTTYQPDEHVLQLTAADLREWAEACEEVVDTPGPIVRGAFVVQPVEE